MISLNSLFFTILLLFKIIKYKKFRKIHIKELKMRSSHRKRSKNSNSNLDHRIIGMRMKLRVEFWERHSRGLHIYLTVLSLFLQKKLHPFLYISILHCNTTIFTKCKKNRRIAVICHGKEIFESRPKVYFFALEHFRIFLGQRINNTHRSK